MVPYAPGREWFTLAIAVTPTARPKPKTEPAKENDGSKSEPRKPADSRQSKPGEAAKPVVSKTSLALAERAKRESVVEPLPAKSFYYTFIVFPTGDYHIGSLDDEVDRQNNELRHRVTLTRPFSLLDREITLEELIDYSPTFAESIRQSNRSPASAAFGANWYDAVGFSRWLSQQAGLSEADQAYAAPESLDEKKYPRETDLDSNWAPRNWPLEAGRRGFRLPTESEWEAASRAGARTAYGFGSDDACWKNSGGLPITVVSAILSHGHCGRPFVDYLISTAVCLSGATTGARIWCRRDHRSAWQRKGLAPRAPWGLYSFGAEICRASYRAESLPTIRAGYFGFRLALTPSEVAP